VPHSPLNQDVHVKTKSMIDQTLQQQNLQAEDQAEEAFLDLLIEVEDDLGSFWYLLDTTRPVFWAEQESAKPTRLTKKQFLEASLVELAEMTGIGDSNWCRWLNNRSDITEKNLVKGSHAIGISPGTLLDWIIERRKLKRLSQK